MPQLEFTWWIVNFFLIWTSVLVVLTLLLNTPSSPEVTQSSSLSINKTTTTWQWL
uniref:ATP synthase complex subunit 8 n=1 Tax=Tripneustes gratilla TaxID=7673 RepID=A0A1W5I1J5_TRIGR|nr:ATP synthase F0 subunit 8 [Tripneustes gratilla]AID60590.1 ATP synthase F0 subunit 8 [Tripneustes gratilla]ARO89830.1 ATP synthase subunit 8 [Tripneustes gratilla]QLM01988.1 ATP synthase F0 subunit 8 [Tripneustes gratilla]WKW91734.1 ATP synthase F0 subunit 8 [Tripneustes gratilla]WKW91747.1 ATP synthase F0 subunit 8 [Tripneustes gratilla]